MFFGALLSSALLTERGWIIFFNWIFTQWQMTVMMKFLLA